MTDFDTATSDATAAPSPAPAETSAPTPDATAAPSPASDATPAAPSSAPDATPASSPGEPVDPKEGLLAAVKKAVEPKKPEAAPTEQAKPGEDPSKASTQDAPQDFSPEEIKTYAPSTQQRIKTLVSERNALRDQVKEVEPFRAYMQENDLSQDDLATALQSLASLRSGDPETFLQTVFPYLQMAMEMTGRALPPDLQTQVQQGRIAPDVAVQMTRQRYELGDARARLERQQEEQAVQYEENARMANRSAVATWEQTMKQSDPDYARKLDVAKAYVSSIRAEYGDPQSPEDAVAIAKEAYRRASDAMKAALPPRAATQMSPSGVQRSPNSGAVAAPRNLMEAAMQGLNAARSRAS